VLWYGRAAVLDVIVMGAGLAGLAAARDLARGGADVLVLEARGRVGGRVEQTQLRDGRLVQLGGEVVGPFHTAYRGLVAELGLTLVPSYVAEPGVSSVLLDEGAFHGDDLPWLTEAERADHDRVEQLFCALARTVDPDDPWGHPDAARLDATSLDDWLRSLGATPAVRRTIALSHLSLSTDRPQRWSLLAELRKQAAASATAFYDADVWESERVEEGSATVALRMAEELGDRVRLAEPVRRVAVVAGGVAVTVADGEELRAGAAVCALPVGPLRDVELVGLDPARERSLRAQRSCLAAKIAIAYERPFWRDLGRNGLSMSERFFGSTWPQREGILSLLVPPERLAAFVAAPPDDSRATVLDEVAALYGDEARAPLAYFTRPWGLDPYTRGYVTAWAPGDLMRVGPLHGTHAPPVWFCGSDQWVAGYMEGAVRTGRAAAASLLGSR
jgi:monoamine oxidase